MNRLIIGTLMVIGVLWGVGVGETKKTLDPRLITKEGDAWVRHSGDLLNPKMNHQQRFYYYADGTSVFMIVWEDGSPGDTVMGTWQTLYSSDGNKIAIVDGRDAWQSLYTAHGDKTAFFEVGEDYVIDEWYEIKGDSLIGNRSAPYTRVKGTRIKR